MFEKYEKHSILLVLFKFFCSFDVISQTPDVCIKLFVLLPLTSGVYTTYTLPINVNSNLNFTLLSSDLVSETSQWSTVGSDALGQHLILTQENEIIYSEDFGECDVILCQCCFFKAVFCV